MNILYFLVVIVIVLLIKSIYDKKRNRRLLIERLKLEWGKACSKEYNEDQIASIASYYESKKDDRLDVDDITWNDLDMDKLFLMMNNTTSSIGEEYLYFLLRRLEFEASNLEEKDKLISYFQENRDKALEIQIELSYLGKMNNISIFEYLNHFNKVKKDSNILHILQGLGLLASLILALVIPRVGVILTFALITYNVITYYKRKGEIDKYINVCSYVIRMIHSIDRLKKINTPEISKYIEELSDYAHKIKSFTRNSFLLTSKNVNGDIGEIILDYIRMLFHVDLIKFNNMLSILRKEEDALNQMFERLGMLDSMVAVASFRTMLPYYTKPILSKDSDDKLSVEEVYHPYISEAVKNNIKVEASILLTGSNASGKSTFLRSIAMNAILSQTIYTSVSKSYKSRYYKVMSSMALKDNILEKESYYIVEIKSLKRIIDSINKDIPILCFVDEVLRGTNTLERIAASSQILNSLCHSNVICFAATHDIELTYILEDSFVNYHFQEEVVEDDVIFDYKLYNGRATSRNAIKLLSVMGYDKDIIENASNKATEFLVEGKWSKL